MQVTTRSLERQLVLFQHLHHQLALMQSFYMLYTVLYSMTSYYANMQVVLDEYNRLDDVLPAHLEDVVDRKLIREAYIYTVAGACFALGLRYAGTADATAKETCIRHLRYYKQMRSV
jgi:hypothetical protein